MACEEVVVKKKNVVPVPRKRWWKTIWKKMWQNNPHKRPLNKKQVEDMFWPGKEKQYF